jgi:hypothetical protein
MLSNIGITLCTSGVLLCEICSVVDAPSPHYMCGRATWGGWVLRSEYSGLGARESDMPNWAAPVTLGWQWQKLAQSSLGSSEGGQQHSW